MKYRVKDTDWTGSEIACMHDTLGRLRSGEIVDLPEEKAKPFVGLLLEKVRTKTRKKSRLSRRAQQPLRDTDGDADNG